MFEVPFEKLGRFAGNLATCQKAGVDNVAVRQDLLQAAAQIEQGESLPQAFEETRYVTSSEKEVIASGDLSGTLERAFERIAFETGEQLTFRMEMITLIATRIMTGLVIYMIAMLVLGFGSR